MKLKSNEFKEFVIFLSIVLLVIIIFSFVLFKMTGIRVVLGIIFISLPFYLILTRFQLPENEKFVFSILMGLTIFPSLVYNLGIIISFRLSIILAFMAFLLTGIILIKYKSKSKENI